MGIPTALRPKPLEDYKAFVVTGEQELFSFGLDRRLRAPRTPTWRRCSARPPTTTSRATRTPTVDAALAAARATADPAAAAAQWAEVERQVLAEAVVVPIAQFRIQAVLSDRVQAFAHRVDGTVDWAAVWVADGA